MSVLDITVEDEQADGSFRKARNSSLWPILTRSTNGLIDTGTWVKTTMGHLLSWGNAYSEIEFSQGGDVLALHLIKPSHITPEIVDDQLVYKYYSRGGYAPDIPAWKMLHFADLSPDGIKGYSRITLARETLAVGRAADLWGASFFGNAARPSGLLKHPGRLSPNAMTNLRETFSGQQAGPMNTGKPAILEEGMDWVQLTIPPNDAQFLETRKFSVEDAARLFGMHPSKIGGPVEGGNLEERNEDYKQSVLLGFCKALERQIELKCIRNDRQRVRFGFEELMRPNATARASYASTMIDRGVASPNDIAAREGFKTYKGGDVRFRPLNMGTVDPATGEFTQPAPPPQDNTAKPGAPSFSATDPNKDQAAGVAS
jgi:HK97 family phage portal protein